VLNMATDALSHMLRYGLELFLEALEPVLISTYRPLLEEIRDQPDVPDSFKRIIDEALSGNHQAGVAILMSLGTSAGGAVVGSVLNSLLAPVTYAVNRKIKPWRLDPVTAAQLSVIRSDLEEHVRGDVLDAGVDDVRFAWLKQAALTRLSPGDWVRYYYRKDKNRERLIARLKTAGFDTTQLDPLLAIAEGIPGIGDIVRMAVREAWNDATASKFGYDEDFPPEFGEWLGKLGYSADWAVRYWRAHWDLPSPGMGFEMFQRGIIDQSTLNVLLRALDIPRFWRDKLVKLAYNTITRVDVRRMWRSGHITDIGELIRRYRDVGYSPEDAVDLAEWTIAEYTQKERNASKTDILKAYELGRVGRDEALDMLESINYQRWLAEVWLANVDNKKINAVINEELGYLRALFVAGEIKEADVNARLAQYGIPAAEVERYLQVWRIRREAKARIPTKSDIHDFFVRNIIDESEYRAALAKQNYSDAYINWYVARSKRLLVEQAQRETEEARREQERTMRKKRKSRYEIRASEIAVQIAELNLAIADLKASVSEDMTYDEVNEIAKTIGQYKLEIKRLQLEKAEARREYLQAIAPQEGGG